MDQINGHIVIPAFNLFAMLKIKYSRSNNIFFIIQLPKAERKPRTLGSYTFTVVRTLVVRCQSANRGSSLIDLFLWKN